MNDNNFEFDFNEFSIYPMYYAIEILQLNNVIKIIIICNMFMSQTLTFYNNISTLNHSNTN